MKRLNKKGFTLIELLAVIVILAVLMLIAMPNVLKMMETSKVSAFKVEGEAVAKAAQQKWAADSITNNQKTCYNATDLAGNYDFKTGYSVAVSITDGKVTGIKFASDKYYIETTDASAINAANLSDSVVNGQIMKQPSSAKSYTACS